MSHCLAEAGVDDPRSSDRTMPSELAVDWGVPSGGRAIGVALAAGVAVHAGRVAPDSWRSLDMVPSGDASAFSGSGERTICIELPAEPGVSMPVAFLLGARQGCRI